MTFPTAARLPLLLALLALLPAAQLGAATRAGLDVVHEVRNRIAASDCGAAVERLKSGLKWGYPEVVLLAGSMYEHGICVKASWDTALTFYVQAHEGGAPEAAERIAAGFADPARGPDAAAALWWNLQGRGSARTEACAVSPQAATDPDRFVAELRTWHPSRLAICNYIVGVISTISAEMRYPGHAEVLGLGGEVSLRFLPAVPRIDLKMGGSGVYVPYGVIRGDSLPSRPLVPLVPLSGWFEHAMHALVNDALRRYPQPAGIPADAQAGVQFLFKRE